MKAILTYHSIDESGSVISIDRQTFTQHMRWLADNVAVVHLKQLLELPEDEHAVAITFDDGFQNFADRALPVLREHGLPATVFVVSDLVGRTNEWSVGTLPAVPHLPLMDWDVLGRLAAENVVIGSHTRTHPNLRLVNGERLQHEVAGAADVITERIGQRPHSFAFPYGEQDDAVIAAARASYSLACTTELRAVRDRDDALQLPRLDTYYFRNPGVLERFGSRAFRRFLWVRRHGRTVRRALVHAGVRV